MKKIAIVTGASSGIGRYFAITIEQNIDVDEIWLIARDKDNLQMAAKEIKTKTKILPYDLTLDSSFDDIENLFKKENVNIKLLVNASGYGKFDKTTKISRKESVGMIKLNCMGVTSMCIIALPYMKKDSSIINIASVAAFQPVPYINIYAATKAYVLRFSRALNMELKKSGIHILAVCPFWTKTNFFKRAVGKNEVVKKYVAMYEPKDIITRAWKDLKKGKEVSEYGFIARSQVFLTKLVPHKLIMKIWMKQQGLE
ncbi:MAG: SDR family NAD(P)-dependent oxidoreductase [Mollicutes bacterium]|nr:SDR family NAD(P)-dependent oxidoreductase [Mollicutes bacterium]